MTFRQALDLLAPPLGQRTAITAMTAAIRHRTAYATRVSPEGIRLFRVEFKGARYRVTEF